MKEGGGRSEEEGTKEGERSSTIEFFDDVTSIVKIKCYGWSICCAY